MTSSQRSSSPDHSTLPPYHRHIGNILFLFILCLILPLCGSILYFGYTDHNRSIENSRRTALDTARTFAEQQLQLTTDIRALLSTIAALPAVRAMDGSQIETVLRNALPENPDLGNVVLADRQGQVAASAIPHEGTVNLSDRKFFIDAVQSKTFSTGESVHSRILDRPSFHFAMPVTSDEGTVRGVLLTAHPFDKYDRLLSRISLPRNARLILADHRLQCLYVWPQQGSVSPGMAVPTEIARSMEPRSGEEGVFTLGGDIDDVTRTQAFVRLRLAKSAPPYMTVLVSIPTPTVAGALADNPGAVMGLVAAVLSALFAARFAGCGNRFNRQHTHALEAENLGLLSEIENRKLSEYQLRIQAMQQATVADFGQNALENSDFDDLADEAVALAAAMLEADFSLYIELLHDHRTAILRSGVGWKEKITGKAIPLGGTEPDAWQSLLSGVSGDFHNPDREPVPSGFSFFADHCIASGTAVPAGPQDCPTGILCVYSASPRSFGRDSIHFLQALANILASVAQRKRSEEALSESEHRCADIINFLPDPTLVVDMEGKVTAWNLAMENLTGIGAAEMLGKGDLVYALPFYGGKRPMLIDLVLNGTENGSAYSMIERQGEILTGENFVPSLRNGHGAFLAGRAAVLKNSRGKVVGAVETIQERNRRRPAGKRTALQNHLRFGADGHHGDRRSQSHGARHKQEGGGNDRMSRR